MCKVVKLGDISIANNLPLMLMAGPCVLESLDHADFMLSSLLEITTRLNIPFVYKSSFDKANRTSINATRGVGLSEAIKIFSKLKDKYNNVPIVTDVHSPEQCVEIAPYVDILQIPAFLCRQTDLLLAAANTGKVINVKKGQFLAPWEMQNIISKLSSTGNDNILLCERGTSFGYNNLVVDMTGLDVMKKTNYPVILDATHSVQKPGGLGDKTGGNREYAPLLAYAASAIGLAGLFLEVHQDPDNAPSDGPNMIKLHELEDILVRILKIDAVTKSQ